LLIISCKRNWLCNFFEIINTNHFFDFDNLKKKKKQLFNLKIIKTLELAFFYNSHNHTTSIPNCGKPQPKVHIESHLGKLPCKK
jgi:hypothetical protein